MGPTIKNWEVGVEGHTRTLNVIRWFWSLLYDEFHIMEFYFIKQNHDFYVHAATGGS